MAVKIHGDLMAKYETIAYAPGLPGTGDLEAATKTISAIEEAIGVGNADYHQELTLPRPNDARLAVMRIATRLSVTIDSDDGVHDLRCRVYVDAQDWDHLLYDLTYSSTGNQLAVQDCLAGTKETIFNLLKDGVAHTYYFHFWSPGNHSPVISLIELWEGVGNTGTETWNEIIKLNFTGLAFPVWNIGILGTGHTEVWLMSPSRLGYYSNVVIVTSDGASVYTWGSKINLLVVDNLGLWNVNCNVATDMKFLHQIEFRLRSEGQ